MEIIKDGEKTPVTSNDHKYINPLTFNKDDFPIIVLADDLRGFISWAIKAHTAGNYNHTFILHEPGMVVSQNLNGFSENKIEAYLTAGMMLKFWRIKDLTQEEKDAILSAINKRLSFPWWRRSYDFLGTLVGQLIHVKWLQNPFQEFCSEEVNDDYIKQVKRAEIMGIKEPSPSELNTYFMKYPQIMECLGYWWED